MRRWLRYVALGLGAIAALVLLVGVIYEQNGHRIAARDYPPRGRLVDIGGRRLQLDCRGAGSPTIVFESGLALDGSLSWALVHDSIARFTRACAYSRAGLLWSDPRAGPQTGSSVAEDLHALLRAAGEAPPLVLVGHSSGGAYVVAYTQRYGGDVAGLVLVDASHPDQVARFREVTPVTLHQSMRGPAIASRFAWTGLVRMATSGMPGQPHEPVEVTRTKAAYASTSLKAVVKEANGLDATFAEVGRAHQLGERPLFVLTAGAPTPADELKAMQMTPAQGQRRKEIWIALQNEEAGWSSHSQHTVVDDATHAIQLDRPDVVIAAVRSVVDSVRARRGP
ncbi:MAG TPA: alpha/beta hydrolase [Gemmatimonadaceae bacterium]|nr:alpha/beta hydrolase [Gemmatimonadaceae bacterium]